MKKITAIISILMILSLFVVGCTADGQSTTTAAVTGEQPADNTPTEPIDNQVVEIETRDTKSESETIDDTLTQIIMDGSYVDEQQYMTPGGEEDIRVTVTVENDIITDVELIGFGELHQNSARYIKAVAAELPSLIIGKPIDNMELPTNIAGSSLTVAAFKESVQDIIEAN